MKVAVGGLVRDRLPQLQVYLRHLKTLTWADRVWIFVLDNCELETEETVLRAFPDAVAVRVRDGAPGYDRDRCRAYPHMAEIRNLLARQAMGLGVDGLVSVDSDIVVTPDLVDQLLAPGRPWVAAVVDNSRGARAAYNVMWRQGQGFTRRGLDRQYGGSADLIGAACFYRRDLLERVKFSAVQMSEDAGFACAAFEAGFDGWYIPQELEHLMTDRQTEIHLACCAVCTDAYS